MTPGRLPISADFIGDTPFLHGNLKLQLEVAHRLLWAGLLKEYDGYKVLMWHTVSPMVLFTRNKPITKLEDFKGLKIRARGALSGKIVEAFGAVPIGTIDTGDLYMALERGTIDGLSTAWNTLGMTKIYEVLSHNVEYGLSGGCVPMIMTQRLWSSLPPDIQLIFNQTSREAEINWIDQQWIENEIARKLFYDRGGKTAKLAPAEEARWDQKMQAVTDQIIASYRAKGLPMDEILAIANLAKQEFGY
jgi:TRAP-type C4-dicarboxylate transport system substrate-binding protein